MAIRSLLSKVSSSISLISDDTETSSALCLSKLSDNNDHNDLDHNHVRCRHQSSIIASTKTIQRLNNYHYQYERFKLNNNVNNANYKVKHYPYQNGSTRTNYLNHLGLIIFIIIIIINAIVNVTYGITISAKPDQIEQPFNQIWWHHINKFGNLSKRNNVKPILIETNKPVEMVKKIDTVVLNHQHLKPQFFKDEPNDKQFLKPKLNLINHYYQTTNHKSNGNNKDWISSSNDRQSSEKMQPKKNAANPTDDELMTQASKLSSYMTRILPSPTNIKRLQSEAIINPLYDDSYITESKVTSTPLDIKQSATKNSSSVIDWTGDLLQRSSSHSRQFFMNKPFTTHGSTSQFGTFHQNMPNNYNSEMESYSNRVWNFFDNNMSRNPNAQNQRTVNRFEGNNENIQSNFDTLFNTHFNKQYKPQQKSRTNSDSTAIFKNNNKQQSQQQTKQPNVLSLNLNHRRKNPEEKEKFRRLIQNIFDSTPRKTFSEFEPANIVNNNNVNGNNNGNLIDNNDEKYTIQIKSNVESTLMDQMPQINHLYHNQPQAQLHKDIIQLKQEHEDNNNSKLSSNVANLFEDQMNDAGAVKANNNNNNNNNSGKNEDADDTEMSNGDIVDKILHNENGIDEPVNNNDEIADFNKNNDHEKTDNENFQANKQQGNINSNRLNEHRNKEMISGNINNINSDNNVNFVYKLEDIGSDTEGFLPQQQHSFESNEAMDDDDNNNNNNNDGDDNNNANTELDKVNGDNSDDNNNNDDGDNANSDSEAVDNVADKDAEEDRNDDDDDDNDENEDENENKDEDDNENENENETDDENGNYRFKEINVKGQKQPQLGKQNSENYQTKSTSKNSDNNIEQPVFGLRVSFNGKKLPIKPPQNRQIIRKKNSILVHSTTMPNNLQFGQTTTETPLLESSEESLNSSKKHLISLVKLNLTNKTPSLEVTRELDPELKSKLITKRKPQQLGKWMDAETFELKNDYDEPSSPVKNGIFRSAIPATLTTNIGSTFLNSDNTGIGYRANAKKSILGFNKKNSVYRIKAVYQRNANENDYEEENGNTQFQDARILNRAALEDNLSANNIDNENDENVLQLFKTLPGVPKQDYPIFSSIPKTRFNCRNHRWQGYYADPETHCQVFHICQGGGRKTSFLCPNGTLFNQQLLICDWWHNVDCNEASEYYEINGQIYEEDFESYRLAEGQGSGSKPATVQSKQPARISVRRMAVLDNINSNNNQDDEIDSDDENAIDENDNEVEEADNVNQSPSTTPKTILNHTIIPITTTTTVVTLTSVPTTTTAPTFAPSSTESNRAFGLTESVFGTRKMSLNMNDGHTSRFQFHYNGTKGGSLLGNSKTNAELSQFSRLVKSNRLKTLQQMKNATMVTRFVRHKFAHQSQMAKTTPLPQLITNGFKSGSMRNPAATVNYSARLGKYHRT